jgi:hypothetical protein
MLVNRGIQGYEKVGGGFRFHGRSPKREFNVAARAKVRLEHLRLCRLIGKWCHQSVRLEKEAEWILRQDFEFQIEID